MFCFCPFCASDGPCPYQVKSYASSAPVICKNGQHKSLVLCTEGKSSWSKDTAANVHFAQSKSSFQWIRCFLTFIDAQTVPPNHHRACENLLKTFWISSSGCNLNLLTFPTEAAMKVWASRKVCRLWLELFVCGVHQKPKAQKPHQTHCPLRSGGNFH